MSVINSEIVRRALPDLETQCLRSLDAAAALRDAVREVASKAGLTPAVLSAYVKARVQDKLEQHEQKAEQMQFLFDSFGARDLSDHREATPEEREAWADEMHAAIDAEEEDDDLDGDEDILSRAGVATVTGED